MPDWLPWVIGIGGGSGIGALITALFNAKSSIYTQMNAFVDQLQEDRKTDREEVKASRLETKALGEKVDSALLLLAIEREYSTDLYVWGTNGAPPPPPVRRTIT